MTSDSIDEPVQPSLSAQGIGASLTVADIRLSLAWYRDVLGFTVHREFERDGQLLAVSLRAGAARLLLAQDDGKKGLDRAKGAGISLQFTTLQDVDAIATRARRAGAMLDTEPTEIMGIRVFRLRDLDGFLLVVSSARDD